MPMPVCWFSEAGRFSLPNPKVPPTRKRRERSKISGATAAGTLRPASDGPGRMRDATKQVIKRILSFRFRRSIDFRDIPGPLSAVSRKIMACFEFMERLKQKSTLCPLIGKSWGGSSKTCTGVRRLLCLFIFGRSFVAKMNVAINRRSLLLSHAAYRWLQASLFPPCFLPLLDFILFPSLFHCSHLWILNRSLIG